MSYSKEDEAIVNQVVMDAGTIHNESDVKYLWVGLKDKLAKRIANVNENSHTNPAQRIKNISANAFKPKPQKQVVITGRHGSHVTHSWS